MPREIVNTGFFITLLSNGSATAHAANTLSQFTNTFGRPCRLDDGVWTVGLTEISFGSFKDGSSSRLVVQADDNAEYSERESLLGENDCESDAENGDTNNIETTRATTTKRRKKVKIGGGKKIKKRDDMKEAILVAVDTVLLRIEISNGFAIEFTKGDLDGLTYSHKKDINFGAFLERMSDRITPKPESRAALITIKKEVLDRITAMLNLTDWGKHAKKYSYVRDHSIDYLLHIYMGSEVSSNIILRTGVRYTSLEDFLDVILMQIPPPRRKTHKLKELFSIFYPDYHSDASMVDMETVDSDENVEILFSEYGAKLVSDTNELIQSAKSDTIPLAALLKDLGANIHNVDSTEMHLVEENAELIAKLKNSMLDTFRGGPLKPISGDDLQTLPHTRWVKTEIRAGDKVLSLEIPLITYKRSSDFLHMIHKQLPDDLKSEAFLSDIVNDLFSSAIVAQTPSTNTTSVILVPKPLSHLLPENAPNVVIVPQNDGPEGPDSSSVGSILNAPTIHRQRTTIISSDDSGTFPTAVGPNPQHIVQVDKSVQVFRPSYSNSKQVTSSQKISEHIFVYIDIITPRRVASESVRALKIIPYDGAHCIRFQNVEYMPLDRTLFDSITTQITDRTGELMNFTNTTVPTYMQLHFKKLDDL